MCVIVTEKFHSGGPSILSVLDQLLSTQFKSIIFDLGVNSFVESYDEKENITIFPRISALGAHFIVGGQGGRLIEGGGGEGGEGCII